MENLCRICLNADGDIEYFTTNTKMQGTQLRDMLESFMPEMNLDISIERAVLCSECCQKLEIAYLFKEKCWATEQRIYQYLEINNTREGGKISLKHMIKCENGILETDELVIKEEPVEESLSLASEEMDEDSTEEEINQDDSLKQYRYHEKNKKVDLKRSFCCDQCEYKAYRQDLLDRHKKKNHADADSKGKLFKCQQCSYSSNRNRHLQRHNFTHNKELPYPYTCSLCSKGFLEKCRLTLHMNSHGAGAQEDKSLYTCEHCNKKYRNKSYLKHHQYKHCDECSHGKKCAHHTTAPRRAVKCAECMRDFCDKRSLIAHLTTHHEKLDHAYNCASCDFKTNWKKNIIRHVQINGH